MPEQEAHELGQQIIVAESDGVVRQKHAELDIAAPKTDRKKSKERLENDYETFTVKEAASDGVAVTDQMIENHVRMIIKESISTALKLEEQRIQADRNFSEYGVDSIVAVNLVNLINRKGRIVLPTTVLFDYSNVDQLTRYIVQNYRDTLQASLQNKAPLAEANRKSSGVVADLNRKQDYAAVDSVARSKRNRFLVQDANAHDGSVFTANDTTYHRIVVERPGGIKDLQIVESKVPGLQEDEVRVAVRAFSLNFGDLLCVKGLYPTMPPYPFTPGFEAGCGVSGVFKV